MPFPLAPAIRGTVVEGALGGAAAALMASTSAVAGDFDIVTAGTVAVEVVVVDEGPKFVASLAPFMFATLRQTEL